MPPRMDTGARPIPPGVDSSGPRRTPPGVDSSGPRRTPPGVDDPSGSRRIPVGPPQGQLDSRLNPVANEVEEAPRPPGPERREDIDPASLTTEMEAIGEDVKKRREVDHTLARFSAVHDELAEQERKRKERKQKLMPWKTEEDEDATEFAEPVVLDEDGEERPAKRGRTPKHSKIVRILKIISLTSAVLVFVSTGLGWGAMMWVDSKFVKVDALGSNSAAVVDAEKQYGDENFLIVGSDSRANAKPEDGVGEPDKELGARSDVLMLAHVPADRKRVVVMSLPRDVRVDRPACEGWDPVKGEKTGEELPAAKGVMSNEAYALGGPKCVTAMMSQITHLNINHFISVDFNGFKSMVDAVGSVNVCVSKPMKDGELGVLFDQPGKYDISGDQALNYVRARKVIGEDYGDYDRITRQQKFLSSLLRKALSNEILLNPGKLNSFINAFAGATKGENVGTDQLLTLGQSLKGLEPGRVSFVTIPHETREGSDPPNDNTEWLVREKADQLFKSIIEGTPLPGETPDANPTPATSGTSAAAKPPSEPGKGKIIDPKTVHLQVLNGDPDSGGAARRLKESLIAEGFDVVKTDDAPAVDKTIIKYGVGGEDAAATLGAAMPGATLQFDVAMGSAVALVIGPNFDEKVVSPQGATAQGTASGQTSPPEKLSVVNGGADPCA
jgi:LCP family protein required for cell wall assembly